MWTAGCLPVYRPVARLTLALEQAYRDWSITHEYKKIQIGENKLAGCHSGGYAADERGLP
jgi:hypothetical protein